jgi:CelD/BcsL family acetyltransferase involved in cellulose biosynthesis
VAVLRFLGHGEGDRLGPVCAPADRAAVAMSLRRALRELGGGSAVLVGDELPCEEGWGALTGATRVRREDAPVMRIDGLSWEEVLAARSRNFREQVAARERRLRRDHDVRLRLTQDAATLSDDLDALVRLHDARWGARSRAFAGARGAFHRDFAAVALERGWLRLWLLEVDGAPRAALLGYRLGGMECLYQLGRDPAWDRSSVGFVVVAHAVRTAVQEGMSEYRFLRGGEGYKARFATDDPGLETIALGRGAGRGAARAAAALPRLPARVRHRLAPAVT